VDAFSEERYFEIRGKGFNVVKENILNIIEEKKRRNTIFPIIRVSFIDMLVNRKEKDEFIRFWREKVDFVDIQVFDNYDVNITESFDMSKRKKWSCIAPFKRVSIMSDGKILPCCNFFGLNIPIGNIYENSLDDAWNSEKMQEIRSGIIHDDLDNCSICQRVGQ
jgi:radical SAM protein with 4Fe4S-binding SPASM domain